MDKEKLRNCMLWDKAVERVTEITYNMNTDGFSSDEIEINLEALTKAVEQLNNFWKEKKMGEQC